MEQPSTKYDLLNQRRHFQPEPPSEGGYIEEYPVNQWPVADHLRQRTHFPDQWNATTEGVASHRPIGRKIEPNHQERPPGRVKHIVPPERPQKGHFPHHQMHHFDHHLAQTTQTCEFRVERKHRSAPAGQPGQEFSVAQAMSRKASVPPSQRRNGVPIRKAGDKTYDGVDKSDYFYSYGSTVAHSVFGNLTGGHNAARNISMRGETQLGTSTRADAFGRSIRKGILAEAQKRPKSQMTYREVRRQQAKAEELREVAELPQDLVMDTNKGQENALEEFPRPGQKNSARGKGKKK